MLPDNASLHLTAIEDAEYKEDKIECKLTMVLFLSEDVKFLFCPCLKSVFVLFTVWNNVYGFDMSCIRKQSMMEPLVDTVDQNQIVTNSQLLKVGQIYNTC